MMSDINDKNNNINYKNKENIEDMVNKQFNRLSFGVATITPPADLRKKILFSVTEQKPLIVKLGIDPTAYDLHLGHSVLLNKLKQFQSFGHRIKLVVGDFTARIGDPTGQLTNRRQLDKDEIQKYAKTYAEQVFYLLDPKKTEIIYNSDWFVKFSMEELLVLTGQCTVARMLEREDFNTRYQQNKPIGLTEFLYPLLQGYDSVILKSDIELGGTDQIFNISMGRNLQRFYGMKEQVALTLPLLLGTDGKRKMSKSWGNHIALKEEPKSFYGKIMSLPDDIMIDYYKLALGYDEDALEHLTSYLQTGALHPRDAKMQLAYHLVARYHDKKQAQDAESWFKSTIQQRELPQDIPTFLIKNNPFTIVDFLTQSSFAASRSDARRLLTQGAVRVNGEKCTDYEKDDLYTGDVIQVGRRKFMKIEKNIPSV